MNKFANLEVGTIREKELVSQILVESKMEKYTVVHISICADALVHACIFASAVC